MEKHRHIETFTAIWQGISLRISYEADWLGMRSSNSLLHSAHLQVESVSPERAPLPITETGYRSHFLAPEQVAEHGGPVEFVRLWMEGSAKSQAWRAYLVEQRKRLEADRQLSLF